MSDNLIDQGIGALDPYIVWTETAMNETVRVQEFQTLENRSEHFTGVDLSKGFSYMTVCKGFWRFGEVDRYVLYRIGDDIFERDDKRSNRCECFRSLFHRNGMSGFLLPYLRIPFTSLPCMFPTLSKSFICHRQRTCVRKSIHTRLS